MKNRLLNSRKNNPLPSYTLEANRNRIGMPPTVAEKIREKNFFPATTNDTLVYFKSGLDWESNFKENKKKYIAEIEKLTLKDFLQKKKKTSLGNTYFQAGSEINLDKNE
ncbi:hypothetical protein HYV50_04635 [Candidatus Pacearchaeota archaeon]|nr:hypothetical protein [Candidatus Pacearchaeota archaeon]